MEIRFVDRHIGLQPVSSRNNEVNNYISYHNVQCYDWAGDTDTVDLNNASSVRIALIILAAKIAAVNCIRKNDNKNKYNVL